VKVLVILILGDDDLSLGGRSLSWMITSRFPHRVGKTTLMTSVSDRSS
jgi:hypothetical protein